jgi:HEPN domain-containing protein
MSRDRSLDWLRQARDDLLWARDTLAAARYAQACFVAQQVAEKAIRALALKQGHSEARSHSILEIARAMGMNDETARIAKRLDQYYISTRYPDAFATGSPFEYFTQEQAEEAVRLASRMVQMASDVFEAENHAEPQPATERPDGASVSKEGPDGTPDPDSQ